MMTNLERAVFLAMAAITERYPNTTELTFDERQEYYKAIIKELQNMIYTGGTDED